MPDITEDTILTRLPAEHPVRLREELEKARDDCGPKTRAWEAFNGAILALNRHPAILDVERACIELAMIRSARLAKAGGPLPQDAEPAAG